MGGFWWTTIGYMVWPSIRRLSSTIEVRLLRKSMSPIFGFVCCCCCCCCCCCFWLSFFLEKEANFSDELEWEWSEVADLEVRFLKEDLELSEEMRRCPMLSFLSLVVFFSGWSCSELTSPEPTGTTTAGWASFWWCWLWLRRAGIGLGSLVCRSGPWDWPLITLIGISVGLLGFFLLSVFSDFFSFGCCCWVGYFGNLGSGLDNTGKGMKFLKLLLLIFFLESLVFSWKYWPITRLDCEARIKKVDPLFNAQFLVVV